MSVVQIMLKILLPAFAVGLAGYFLVVWDIVRFARSNRCARSVTPIARTPPWFLC